MVAQVEKYRHDEVIEDLEVDEEAERRKALVEQLGFDPKLQCVDELTAGPSKFYPELTGFELAIWTLFHRSYYSRNDDEWGGYHFDRVPTPVLEEISTAVSLDVFSDVELWTPGPKDLDPMVVGVVGHRLGDREREWWIGKNAAFRQNARFYPVVRWGESLLSFDEIKEQVFQKMVTLGRGVTNPLPPPVEAHVRQSFVNNPQRDLHITRASWLAQHCRERMYNVGGTVICVVCGETVS